MKKLLAIALCAALAGCATTGGTGTSQVQRAKDVVNIAQIGYSAVLPLATAYKQLPDCAAAGAPRLCSDANVVAKMSILIEAAGTALTAAQAIVDAAANGDPNQTAIVAAQQAVTAVVTIVNSLPK